MSFEDEAFTAGGEAYKKQQEELRRIGRAPAWMNGFLAGLAFGLERAAKGCSDRETIAEGFASHNGTEAERRYARGRMDGCAECGEDIKALAAELKNNEATEEK